MSGRKRDRLGEFFWSNAFRYCPACGSELPARRRSRARVRCAPLAEREAGRGRDGRPRRPAAPRPARTTRGAASGTRAGRVLRAGRAPGGRRRRARRSRRPGSRCRPPATSGSGSRATTTTGSASPTTTLFRRAGIGAPGAEVDDVRWFEACPGCRARSRLGTFERVLAAWRRAVAEGRTETPLDDR